MKKSFITLATATTLTITMGASASAQQYEVRKGDTLSGISQEYGTSVENLMKWNNLSNHTIYPEQELTVSSKEFYTVKKGDTLWGISSQYGITVDSLMSWNALHTDLIHPGDELVINLDHKKAQPVNVEEQSAPSETTEEAAPVTTTTDTKETSKEETTVAKEITVEATAYTANCDGCSGTTATGVNLKENPDQKVIAVDPNVIPLGSKVYVEGYGYATAEDTGGAIQGNKIDVFIPSEDEAMDWGRRTVNVQIIE
jgi:3D (Asp-Asp-Asp) domain-containing protein